MIVLVGLIAACGDGVAVEGCKDVVNAIADRAEACGFDREVNAQVFEDAATLDMGCGQTDRLRDVTSLYESCIPFLEGVSCAELETGFMPPPSCDGQLLFRE